jgi:2-dehydropantoate 2-reductase
MKIVFFGAGSIGCYVGGHLAASGADVTLFGRDRLAIIIRDHGLTLTQFGSEPVKITDVAYQTDITQLKSADIVVLTVKSQDTEAACQQLKSHISKKTVLVSLQNGIGNTDVIRAALPGHKVYGGMVPYNVIGLGEGRFHKGTGGDLVFEDGVETQVLVEALNKTVLSAVTTDQIRGVQWSKLLTNLNNALNLLSDKPLQQQIGDRDYRRVWADMIEEGLAVLEAADIQPAAISGPDPVRLRKLLRLPNFIYKPVVKRIAKIDPQARSSMWEDLKYGRSPEIDYLQGEISRLGLEHSVKTPVNDRISELVKQAFDKKKSPALSGYELRALL